MSFELLSVPPFFVFLGSGQEGRHQVLCLCCFKRQWL
uniref:U1 small nuclear ribonucleoprotein A-like n=1 Tax=Rhizophora mucronata TaxID=61149 RepID=A0A2P2KNI6_RHIMU